MLRSSIAELCFHRPNGSTPEELEPLALVLSIRHARELRGEGPGKLSELKRPGDTRQIEERLRDAQELKDLGARVVKGSVRVGGKAWEAELPLKARFLHRAQSVNEAPPSGIASGVRHEEDLVELFGGDAWWVVERVRRR